MVTSVYGPRMAWHGCTVMVWSNNSHESTWPPCDARTDVVRAQHGNLQTRMGLTRGLQGCRTAPVRTRNGFGTIKICKNPAPALHLAVEGPRGPLTVPARVVHGLFAISKPVRIPKAYNACIKTLRPRTGRQNSYGAAWGRYGPRGWTYEFSSKQSGNSPHGARECDVTGALCLSHITLPGPVRAVPVLFWTKIVRPLTGPARAPCGAVRILPPRTGPVEF